jgi:hypothetical protein
MINIRSNIYPYFLRTPVRTEVVKASTGDRFLVPTKVINLGSKSCPEDGIVYPVTERR